MHTPGPWKLAPCSNGGLILRRGEAIKGDRHPQSHLQIVPVEDAYLIAAAPDLLAALKWMVTYYGPAHDVDCPQDDTCSCSYKEINDSISAAISKAEGKP